MKSSQFDPNCLILSVVYRMFSEWLRRNGYYSKFMANVSASNPCYSTPQLAVRACFSIILRSRSRVIGDVITSSFLFDSTPEGSDYWSHVSAEWVDFTENFSIHF